jgi:hypothetical protein
MEPLVTPNRSSSEGFSPRAFPGNRIESCFPLIIAVSSDYRSATDWGQSWTYGWGKKHQPFSDGRFHAVLNCMEPPTDGTISTTTSVPFFLGDPLLFIVNSSFFCD